MSWSFNRSMLSWFSPVHWAGFCNIKAFDNGSIKPNVKVEEKAPSNKNDDSTLELPNRPGKESTSSESSEQPHLEVAGSGKHAINDDARVDIPAEEEGVTNKPQVAQEDVNIFTLQEEAGASEDPFVDDQHVVQEPLPESSTSTSQSTTQSEKDHDDTASSNGSQLDDIEGLLLDEHQLDASDVQAGTTAGVGAIPTITSTTSTTPSPESASNVPAAQKGQPESVFLRLSNRVKALERNMSLSGQYLEELSRRYRKQVEELQQSHARTLQEIEEQNHRIRENEEVLRQENVRLREEFSSFRDNLLNWKSLVIALGAIAITQVLVCWIVLRSCRKQAVNSPDRETIDRELAQVSNSGKPIRGKLLRRKSIDGVMSGAHLGLEALKKKRPSEEALNITGTYESLLIEDIGRGDSGRTERKRSKHKHKKTSAPSGYAQQMGNVKTKRATSAEPPEARMTTKPDLIRTESAPEPRRQTPEMSKLDEHNRIDELPLLEDNDEFIIPTASDLSFNEFVPDSTSEMVSKTNGMASSTSSIDSKVASKAGKGRRLSSPAFFKSSFLRASRRSSGKKLIPSQNTSSASSNTSSSGSSSVRININVNHNSGSAVEEDLSLIDAPSLETSVTTTSFSNNNNNSNSGGNEWYKLKKSSSQDKFAKRKAKSESPGTVGNGSINGTDSERKLKTSTSFNGSTSSNEKKIAGNGGSFRRLFRKVF